MNRAEIIDLVSTNTGINADDTETVVNGLLEAIGDTLVTDRVDLDVFGEFTVVEVEGTNMVEFKGGSELSGKVN